MSLGQPSFSPLCAEIHLFFFLFSFLSSGCPRRCPSASAVTSETWEASFIESPSIPQVQKLFKLLGDQSLPQPKFRKLLQHVLDFAENNVRILHFYRLLSFALALTLALTVGARVLRVSHLSFFLFFASTSMMTSNLPSKQTRIFYPSFMVTESQSCLFHQLSSLTHSNMISSLGLYEIFSSAVKNHTKEAAVASDLKQLELPKIYIDDIVAAYTAK